jgi:hypothetical protein
VVFERLAHGEEAVEVDVLLREADPGARLLRVVRLAEDEHLALRHPQEVAHGADQRGLAGAVGTQEPEEGARVDLEVEVLERERPVVVTLGEAPQFEGRRVVAVHLVETSDAVRRQRLTGVGDSPTLGP